MPSSMIFKYIIIIQKECHYRAEFFHSVLQVYTRIFHR
nr:MAG TPA: hypothetical protein [Caudoviricetes sp.]